MVQIILKTLHGGVRCVELPKRSSISQLKERISDLEGIPSEQQRLISSDFCGISSLQDEDSFLLEKDLIFVTLSLTLVGGKGGFGSLLRGGPQGIFN